MSQAPETVEEALVRGSAMSAVNLAEVLSKLAEVGQAPASVNDALWRRGLLGGQDEKPWPFTWR